MEEEKYVPGEKYCSARIMSSEIIELGEESKSLVADDVYVAVGKDDLEVLKWALDHAVSPGTRVFLVHVFAPITYIPTPVGRLSKSQLSREQLRVYTNEENNKRRKLLEKYIRLCNDAKVTVDTMLVESNVTAKAIVDLVPVLNITKLVMGTKRPPCSRSVDQPHCLYVYAAARRIKWPNSSDSALVVDHESDTERAIYNEFYNKVSQFIVCRGLRKKMGKGEFVKKNAPDYCEVTIIHGGKKMLDSQQDKAPLQSSSLSSSNKKGDFQRNSFDDCTCFTGVKSRILKICTAPRGIHVKGN